MFRASILLAALVAGGAQAAEIRDYQKCVDLAQVSPEVVRAEAIAWYAETGDPGALHCEAIALSEIGALRSAAAKMQTVAQLPDIDTLTRVDLLTQAALLWRQDGSSDAAFGALDTALKYQRTPRVLIERSILHAERRAWEEAKADLDEALRMAPGDDEALALRAAANRRLGDHRAALQDAEQAIAVRPVSAAGWFELGKAELALGRKNGARRAWLKAIDVSPGGPYAALARGQLQDMDGGG